VKRRQFITGMGGTAAISLLGQSLSAQAQTPGRVYRLGHLANTPFAANAAREIILPELAKLGFVEGRNFVFDPRVGEAAAMPGLMIDLLAARPDVVIAVGEAAMVAAAASTRTVPIVGFGADAVLLGLAKSYAQPGGNVTGVSILIGELEVKRLSLLREAAPDRRRVAALVSATQRQFSEPAMRKAAAGFGIELLVFSVASSTDYPAAFAAMRAAGAEALLIGAAPELFRDGKQLAGLALEAKLPTMCEWAEMAHAGCLIGYGPNRVALRRRLAAQVALIFRGTAPGDVAIELPTVYEFALNQKIANALGVAIPLSVLAKADEVIE
jgi:putative tryptophan/tyrosine transport system substrate-binding protein